ncbi:MAG: ABC transporter, permease protein (cluster 13, osmolytes), partial [uncultured Blastococcus sp.]
GRGGRGREPAAGGAALPQRPAQLDPRARHPRPAGRAPAHLAAGRPGRRGHRGAPRHGAGAHGQRWRLHRRAVQRVPGRADPGPAHPLRGHPDRLRPDGDDDRVGDLRLPADPHQHLRRLPGGRPGRGGGGPRHGDERPADRAPRGAAPGRAPADDGPAHRRRAGGGHRDAGRAGGRRGAGQHHHPRIRPAGLRRRPRRGHPRRHPGGAHRGAARPRLLGVHARAATLPPAQVRCAGTGGSAGADGGR